MNNSEGKTKFSQYLGLTFLIGFGFLTMGLMDPLYDTYIPIFLKRYIASNAAVGGIMTLDNVLQLFLIPVIAVWSDRTRTRLGRRMPFIVVMLPAAAVLFSLIPPLASVSLAALVAIIFFFNIFKTSVRGPVVALMPDTIPGDFRSEANGVINMMGGIGLIIGTLALAPLMSVRESLPFNTASVVIILAVVVLLVFVRERKPDGAEEAEEKAPVRASVKMVFGSADKSAALILVSILFWFLAYEGAKPFLGLYMMDAMGVPQGWAALAQGIAGISSVIVAVPSGYFAHRLGRRNYIRLCLALLALVYLAIPVSGALAPRFGFSAAARLAIFLGLMFIYGAVWIGIVVNSFPMLWQMASFSNMGIYTGLYYLFSQGAAILAPPLTGLVIDLSGGYGGVFIFGLACMIPAIIAMGKVKSGEAGGCSSL